MLEASLLVIGDEILAGHVTDVNSPWAADRLRALGVPLTWMQVVKDDLDVLDEALSAELARSRPRVIITSGGLGSTPDDLTYEAIAASLGRPLVEDPTMAAKVAAAADRAAEYGIEVDETYRRQMGRMAQLPAGSRLLWREGSWLPAAAVDVDGGSDTDAGATIVILPGVPEEFRALFTDAVEPAVLAGRGVPQHLVEIVHHFPESVLNHVFLRVERDHPDVSLGSYPGDDMIVRLVGPEASVEAAAALVRDAVHDLEASPAGQRLLAAWRSRS